jgi:hypothetical protein
MLLSLLVAGIMPYRDVQQRTIWQNYGGSRKVILSKRVLQEIFQHITQHNAQHSSQHKGSLGLQMKKSLQKMVI